MEEINLHPADFVAWDPVGQYRHSIDTDAAGFCSPQQLLLEKLGQSFPFIPISFFFYKNVTVHLESQRSGLHFLRKQSFQWLAISAKAIFVHPFIHLNPSKWL